MSEVVQAQEREAEQFLTTDQMVQVGPCVPSAACGAGAGRVQGSVVMAETRIARVPSFTTHEGCAMTAEPGGENAIEEVDAVDVEISGLDATSEMALSVTVRGAAVCGTCSTATPQADRNIKAANPECLGKDSI